MPTFSPYKKFIGQRGAATMVGIAIVSLLLLVAMVFGYFALTSKEQATLTVNPTEVKAGDLLTKGRSNNELAIDTKIVIADLERDTKQQTAAKETLDEEPLPVGDGITTNTIVEAERLSRLQTEYIAEADRRLGILNDTAQKTDDLTVEQKTIANKLIGDEITALTGLKAKTAAETTKEGFLKDRDELDKQYVNYGLAVSQVYLLLWANDQTVLDEKINVLGGKFQERINEASGKGSSTAKAQTALNGYQTNKTLAKDGTAAAIKKIMATKPNTFEANRQVLKGYYNELATVHNELKKAVDAAKELTLEIRTYR